MISISHGWLCRKTHSQAPHSSLHPFMSGLWMRSVKHRFDLMRNRYRLPFEFLRSQNHASQVIRLSFCTLAMTFVQSEMEPINDVVDQEERESWWMKMRAVLTEVILALLRLNESGWEKKLPQLKFEANPMKWYKTECKSSKNDKDKKKPAATAIKSFCKVTTSSEQSIQKWDDDYCQAMEHHLTWVAP